MLSKHKKKSVRKCNLGSTRGNEESSHTEDALSSSTCSWGVIVASKSGLEAGRSSENPVCEVVATLMADSSYDKLVGVSVFSSMNVGVLVLNGMEGDFADELLWLKSVSG